MIDPQLEIKKSSFDEFTLPCGYVDQDGVVHTSVVVREMNGDDEETLAAKNMPSAKKVNRILTHCTESIGTYSGAAIERIIPELTQGDRIFLLIAIRRASLGNDMPFQTKCPACKADSRFVLDLGDLEVKRMKNPATRVYDLELPRTKRRVRMRVLTGKGEDIISKAMVKGVDMISNAMLARMESIDDKPVTVDDLKELPLADRNFIRNSWEDHEGGVDTAVQIDCQNCQEAYETELDISQQGFFNPSATLSNWKKKYSF